MFHTSKPSEKLTTQKTPSSMSDIDLNRLDDLRQKHHSQCCACADPRYRLDFTCGTDHSLVAQWQPDQQSGSYSNTLHGGIQSLLIDQSMICCLMAYGIIGVTADLRFRFRHPINLTEPVEIRTRLTDSHPPLYQLQSEIFQSGKLCIIARGKFMPR